MAHPVVNQFTSNQMLYINCVQKCNQTSGAHVDICLINFLCVILLPNNPLCAERWLQFVCVSLLVHDVS